MSWFWALPPEVQSILVAIVGTVAGTVVSNLFATKKTMKVIVVLLILSAGIGAWIAAQRFFEREIDFPGFFDTSSPGIVVTNHSYGL